MNLFPSDRISDLERDVRVKRDILYRSQDRLVDRAKSQLTAKTMLKGGLMGALVGLPTLFLAGRFMMGGGLVSKVAKAGLLFGMKTAAPVIKPMVASLIKKILKKF